MVQSPDEEQLGVDAVHNTYLGIYKISGDVLSVLAKHKTFFQVKYK